MTPETKSAIIGCHLNGATINQIIIALNLPFLEVAPVLISYLKEKKND